MPDLEMDMVRKKKTVSRSNCFGTPYGDGFSQHKKNPKGGLFQRVIPIGLGLPVNNEYL